MRLSMQDMIREIDEETDWMRPADVEEYDYVTANYDDDLDKMNEAMEELRITIEETDDAEEFNRLTQWANAQLHIFKTRKENED